MNKADPCVLGSQDTSLEIFLISSSFLPSIRDFLLIICPRTISFSIFLKYAMSSFELISSFASCADKSLSLHTVRAECRSILSVKLYALAISSEHSFFTNSFKSVFSTYSNFHGSFAHSSARSMIMSITGCISL